MSRTWLPSSHETRERRAIGDHRWRPPGRRRHRSTCRI